MPSGIAAMVFFFFCEYPSEGLNYNSDINNVRMWIILFLY